MTTPPTPLFTIGTTDVAQAADGTYLVDDGEQVRTAAGLQQLRGLLEEDDMLSGAEDARTSGWDLPQLLDFWASTSPGWPNAEAEIDGVLVCDSGLGPMPALYEFDSYTKPLAEASWDLGPGGAGSPGRDDDGSYSLFKFGGRYLLVERRGVEYTVEAYEAADDEAAIARFEDDYSES